mgnify:CR=1 FL=1
MEIRQGEIYWIELDEPTGSEPGYRRPCLVVQNDIFNQSAIRTVVVCMLTSNLARAKLPGNVLLESGESGLEKASVVNTTQIFTVNKSDLENYICTIPEKLLTQVINGIDLLLKPAKTLR